MKWGNVKEAAVSCGLPTESWRSWERDGREPRGLLNVSLKIAGVTGCDYRWLALGPDDRAAEAVAASVGDTRRYAAIGERVVAVGLTDRPTPSGSSGSSLRTRPIDQRRLATVGSR